MRIEAFGQSERGREREVNTDALVLDTSTGFFMVADGVSSAPGGDMASQMASQLIHERIQKARDELVLNSADRDRTQAHMTELLTRALNAASELIYNQRQADYSCHGMATTATALCVVGSLGMVGHVGDSRAYLIREGKVYRVTDDHTLVRELLSKGALRPEDAPNFPHRKVLSRTLGRTPHVEVDTLILDFVPGDRLVLCTNGLTEVLKAEEVRQLIAQLDARSATPQLIQTAQQRGSRDNISVIVVDFMGEFSESHTIRTEQKVNLLREIFLFKDLTFPEVMRVLPMVREVRYRNSDVILREGDMGTELYVVVDGRVDISRRGVFVNRIEKGGHFGDLGLIGGGIRTATVVSSGDTTLLELKQEDFYDLVRSDHALAVKLLWGFLQNLAVRVNQLTDQIAEQRGGPHGH